MEDLFKKFLYTGIGLVSLTKERLQKNIDELVSNQKLSREEGKKIIEDVMQKTSSGKGDLEAQLKKLAEEMMDHFKYARHKEVEALEKRVKALEVKMSKTKVPKEAPVENKRTFETATAKGEAPAPKKRNVKKTQTPK